MLGAAAPPAVKQENSRQSEENTKHQGRNNDAGNGACSEKEGWGVDIRGRSTLIKGEASRGFLEGGAREAVCKGLEGGGVWDADEGVDLGGEGGGSRAGGGDNLEVNDDAARGHAQNRHLVRADSKRGYDEGNEGLLENCLVIGARRVPSKD